MKDENALLEPPPVVTIMLTAPAAASAEAGVIQFIAVLLLIILKDAAFIPSNVTAVTPIKLAPVMVREVPPSVLPDDFEMLVIVGGVIKVKEENGLLGPPAVVTMTPTTPAGRAGVIQVIVVLLTTIISVETFPPNVTELASVKLVPVIVTLVPPSLVPDDCEMLLMVGGVI